MRAFLEQCFARATDTCFGSRAIGTTLICLVRLQIVSRGLLPNFIFGPDVAVAVGQGGRVANALRGVIFSDGIESDSPEFSSGIKATIGVAELDDDVRARAQAVNGPAVNPSLRTRG